MHSFRIDNATRLLYMDKPDRHVRLCIPEKAYQIALSNCYDDRAHAGISWTYEWLRRNVFFPRMKREVKKYVDGCPICRASKPSNHLLYRKLQPIESPTSLLITVAMDFIVRLLESATGNNCIWSITDKFLKFVQFLPGKETFSVVDWANQYFDHVYWTWEIPQIIILDRDPKFTSIFWKVLFKKAKVCLGMMLAYHPSADS